MAVLPGQRPPAAAVMPAFWSPGMRSGGRRTIVTIVAVVLVAFAPLFVWLWMTG